MTNWKGHLQKHNLFSYINLNHKVQLNEHPSRGSNNVVSRLLDGSENCWAACLTDCVFLFLITQLLGFMLKPLTQDLSQSTFFQCSFQYGWYISINNVFLLIISYYIPKYFNMGKSEKCLGKLHAKESSILFFFPRDQRVNMRLMLSIHIKEKLISHRRNVSQRKN